MPALEDTPELRVVGGLVAVADGVAVVESASEKLIATAGSQVAEQR